MPQGGAWCTLIAFLEVQGKLHAKKQTQHRKMVAVIDGGRGNIIKTVVRYASQEGNTREVTSGES